MNGNDSTVSPRGVRSGVAPTDPRAVDARERPWGQRLARRLYYSPAFRETADLAARALQRALEARATDASDVLTARRCLVLAPHPDDETLACGATIRRKTAAGTDVVVAIATDGRHSHRSAVITTEELVRLRRREALEACARLGVPPGWVHFLDYEEGTLGSRRAELEADLRVLLAEVGAEEVLIPAGRDLHADHRDLNAAALAVLAGARPRPAVLEYPVWFWDAQSWVERNGHPARMLLGLMSGPLIAATRLPVVSVRTEGHLAAKLEALEAYRSQLTNLTGEPTWATFDRRFLTRFTGDRELFFPVDLNESNR